MGNASPDSSDPARAHRAAIAVIERLTSEGYTAYLAGGCVRDMLLGRTPVDYDVATEALPDVVEALFPGSITTGKCFGVVRVRLDSEEVEVATFRADHGYHDGRHPDSVTFSDPETDALRRDFTINALFMDIRHEDQVIDFVNGQRDLGDQTVRCVGDPETRFKEDHLRMLRAVRFTSVLAFQLDAATADAIREQATCVTDMAAERIRDELTRMLTESPRAGDALMLLDEVGLLDPLLPEISAMRGTPQPPQFHPEGDVLEHTVLMLNEMESPSPQLAWSVLLHDVGKPPTITTDTDRIRFNNHASVGGDMTVEILRRLRFPNDDIDFITACVRGHMRTMDVPHMRRSTLRRMVGAPTFPVELELHRLDCVGSHGDLDNYGRLVAFQDEMANEPVLPSAWITGADVLQMGIQEGPQVGHWLRLAYEAQLEDRFPDRDTLLAWLKEQVGS
ncbi:MAG: CCA tRNA nucleotidyltransferase [Kiritimatiellae bacterium]|nr:CCA tRNA nucleotidyltransferase [Kiritimatiellia bacterium]